MLKSLGNKLISLEYAQLKVNTGFVAGKDNFKQEEIDNKLHLSEQWCCQLLDDLKALYMMACLVHGLLLRNDVL